MTQDGEGNLIGKRYRCTTCGSEVICVKAGLGRVGCHGGSMELLAAKPLPATD
jgi:Desulfoferrodoxin, N-terminal domain